MNRNGQTRQADRPTAEWPPAEPRTARKSQPLFPLAYVCLFVYLFVLRPAPEQAMRYAIPLPGTTAAESGLVNAAESRAVTAPCGLETQLAGWATGSCLSPAALLTDWQKARFWVDQQAGRPMLHGELTWHVRGGLLGNLVDRVLLRDDRQQAMVSAMRELHAGEEPTCVRQFARLF